MDAEVEVVGMEISTGGAIGQWLSRLSGASSGESSAASRRRERNWLGNHAARRSDLASKAVGIKKEKHAANKWATLAVFEEWVRGSC